MIQESMLEKKVFCCNTERHGTIFEQAESNLIMGAINEYNVKFDDGTTGWVFDDVIYEGDDLFSDEL